MKILIVLFFSFMAAQGQAFTLVDTAPSMKGWDTKNLIFHLNPANCRSDIRDVIKDAMSLWNSVAFTNLILELGPDTSATPAQAAAFNFSEDAVIVCDTAFTTTTPGLSADTIPGYANYTLGNRNQLVKGFLMLNAQSGGLANLSVISGIAAKVVVAHEMGHVLGLGHSSLSAALMYYNGSYKTDLSLAEDDENGIG